MPREPKPGTFVVGKVHRELSAPYMTRVMIDEGHAIPQRFTLTFDLVEPQFVVTIDIVMEGSRPTVRRLEAIKGRRDERNFIVGSGDGITTTNLRQILVDQLVRRAIEEFREPVEQLTEDERASLISTGVSPTVVGNAFRIPGVMPAGQFQFSPPAKAHNERASTKARIVEAAELFKRAVAGGSKSPQKDVALAMGISTSQVSRHLKSAREDGLLDEPKKPLSEMPPEDYARMREGMGIGELDLSRNPESE